MAYSCTDFVDDVLNALRIEVPEAMRDDPAGQAGLVLAEITRLTNAQLELASLKQASDPPQAQPNDPAPAMAYYDVEFQVFLADGGQMTVLAPSNDDARAQVVFMVEGGDYEKNPSVQEVIINSCIRQKP